jgi:hypothetical protein
MNILFTVHLYGDLGAHQNAHLAAGALLRIVGGCVMITGLVEAFGGCENTLLAMDDAEVASLAVFRSYYNPALCLGH